MPRGGVMRPPARPWTRRLLDILRKSGPAPCSVRLLSWVCQGGWAVRFTLRFLRLRFSPDLLDHVRALPLPLVERSRRFSQAISQVNVNETYKTTGLERTRLADAAILRLAHRFNSVRLLDVGVSDGSASVHLLRALPNLQEALLTDLHPVLYRRGPAWLQLFLDGQSRVLGIKLLGLYVNLSLDKRLAIGPFKTIETINPLLREEFGITAIRPFDAMQDRLPVPVQIIKCANILNRAYFPREQVLDATSNLALSLVEGGVLVISHNNAVYHEGEAYLALEKRDGRLKFLEGQGGHESLGLFREALGSQG